MAQTLTRPKPLFKRQNMNVLLHKDDSGDVYLTLVELWKETPSSPELDTLKHEKAFRIACTLRERIIHESFITEYGVVIS